MHIRLWKYKNNHTRSSYRTIWYLLKFVSSKQLNRYCNLFVWFNRQGRKRDEIMREIIQEIDINPILVPHASLRIKIRILKSLLNKGETFEFIECSYLSYVSHYMQRSYMQRAWSYIGENKTILSVQKLLYKAQCNFGVWLDTNRNTNKADTHNHTDTYSYIYINRYTASFMYAPYCSITLLT